MIYIDFNILMNLKLFLLLQCHLSDWLQENGGIDCFQFYHLWQTFAFQMKQHTDGEITKCIIKIIQWCFLSTKLN